MLVGPLLRIRRQEDNRQDDEGQCAVIQALLERSRFAWSSVASAANAPVRQPLLLGHDREGHAPHVPPFHRLFDLSPERLMDPAWRDVTPQDQVVEILAHGTSRTPRRDP